jgi:PAS domain S-box-containing protein
MSSRGGNAGGASGTAARLVTKERAGALTTANGEAYFQTLFDSALDAFLVLSANAKFIDANPAACQLIGLTRSELIGRSVTETIETSTDFETAWGKFLTDGKYRGQRWLVRPDGSRRLIEIRATANVLPDRHFAIWRDVTDRYFLENELVRREKDQAVAQLAAGMAHDFTNLLHVIRGHAELMTHQIAPNSEPQRCIDRILASTKQASVLASQLSELGRQQVLHPMVLDLSALLRGCGDALKSLIPENVELVSLPAKQPAPVRVDRTQMAQIVFGLASAAGKIAMEHGRLTVAVKNVNLEDAVVKPGVRVPPGDYIVLEMQTGGEKRRRASDSSRPLAAASAQPNGSSVDLPAVGATVKQNNGYLWAESSAGDTTFRVYFHRMASEPLAMPLPETSGKLGGNETILLVEDDPTLREATREYLKSLGYRVLRAGNGEEALAAAKSVEHIDALVADLRMPKMGGKELAEKLAVERPGIKIMFVSGNIDRELIQAEAEQSGPALLSKPFELRVLASTLRTLLEGENNRDNRAQ